MLTAHFALLPDINFLVGIKKGVAFATPENQKINIPFAGVG